MGLTGYYQGFTICRKLFLSIKVLLDFAKPLKVDVDGSFVGAGAVLLQDASAGTEHRVYEM